MDLVYHGVPSEFRQPGPECGSSGENAQQVPHARRLAFVVDDGRNRSNSRFDLVCVHRLHRATGPFEHFVLCCVEMWIGGCQQLPQTAGFVWDDRAVANIGYGKPAARAKN